MHVQSCIHLQSANSIIKSGVIPVQPQQLVIVQRERRGVQTGSSECICACVHVSTIKIIILINTHHQIVLATIFISNVLQNHPLLVLQISLSNEIGTRVQILSCQSQRCVLLFAMRVLVMDL